MPLDINITLDQDSVDDAIKQLEEYSDALRPKVKKLAWNLGVVAYENAQRIYDSAKYDGLHDVSVDVREFGDEFKPIVEVEAEGFDVLFIEFGAGIRYGWGHPWAEAFGYGPGTYPSKLGNWDNPNGWTVPKSRGGMHTYGNPPAMAMFRASESVRFWLAETAAEVFA